jgi:hypothetical protein
MNDSVVEKQKKEAELLNEIRQHLIANPGFAGKLSLYFKMQARKYNDQYDSAGFWEDICRLQGRKRLIKEINKSVLGAT